MRSMSETFREGYRTSLRTHFLSWTMLNVAVVNLVFAATNVMLRNRIHRAGLVNPDMLDDQYWQAQMLLSALQVLVIAVFFGYSYWLLKRKYRGLIRNGVVNISLEAEDGDAALSGQMILQLMQLWSIIMVGVKVVDVIFTDIYRRFIADLFQLFDLADSKSMAMFRTLYNNTHAFKYIGMLIAISLGIFITGIFLSDRILKIAATGLMILFILSATLMQMGTLTVMNRSVGIVWSSALFQLLQTVGLLAFSFYLRKRYRGI